jgi:hypothetical protein
MPMSSNHTEVSVHCCHGKHTAASSRILFVRPHAVISEETVSRDVMRRSTRTLETGKSWYRNGTISLVIVVPSFHIHHTSHTVPEGVIVYVTCLRIPAAG